MRAGRNGSDLRCLIRRIFPGANPLRRRTDYFEPVALLLVALIAVATVVAALFVAQSELRGRLADVDREQAAKHQVVATVVAELGDAAGTAHRPVAVRWGQAPDEHFAVIQLPARAPAAGTVPVWLDQQGQPTSPPLTRAEATQAAGMAGASVLLGSALFTTVALMGARLIVTRTRLAAWAAEWEKVGPQWRNHAS
ncbi:Rv1733c family protein [Saccharopolyspora shandongensis]|uniref:Rv1733c family protein n=1 Tax=Saccharopolyspora shandongensis TaxID=418495 RepID=UPI0033D8EF7A